MASTKRRIEGHYRINHKCVPPNVQRGQIVPLTAPVGQYVPKGVLHTYVVFLPSQLLDDQLEITNGFLDLNFIG